MTSYRIEYTEVKPGDPPVEQCDLVYGRRVDVLLYLAPRLTYIVPGSVKITEYTMSDSYGRRVYGFPGEKA